MPRTSGRIAETATTAAPISLPTSIRPVVSIVTWTWIGTLRPTAGHRPAAADHRRLHLQQVHARLDEEQVDAADEQAVRLLLVGVAQLGEPDVPEARQLRAGTDRAGHVAGPAVGGVVVGDLAGDARRGDVELVGRSAMSYSASTVEKLPKLAVSTASTPTSKNAACMPAMTSGRVRHSISLQPSSDGAAEVVGGQVEALHVRAERPVEDDDALVHRFEVRLRRHGGPRLSVGSARRSDGWCLAV